MKQYVIRDGRHIKLAPPARLLKSSWRRHQRETGEVWGLKAYARWVATLAGRGEEPVAATAWLLSKRRSATAEARKAAKRRKRAKPKKPSAQRRKAK